MKEIMAQESTKDEHGFATFGFDPLAGNQESEVQGSLFEVTSPNPLEVLAADLLVKFAAKTLTVEQIYQQHSIGRRYTLQNYKDAIKKLDAELRVYTDPPSEKRRRSGNVTLGDSVLVTFPKPEV
jgi:hypothetical protein